MATLGEGARQRPQQAPRAEMNNGSGCSRAVHGAPLAALFLCFAFAIPRGPLNSPLMRSPWPPLLSAASLPLPRPPKPPSILRCYPVKGRAESRVETKVTIAALQAWRKYPLFDNIFQLVGVAVITVQLR